MRRTKTKYPASMKKLTAVVRNKAIEIANALLKAKKKMEEGKLIATAIKRAKAAAAKSPKKAKPVKNEKEKVKSVGKAKTKKSASAKRKSIALKKVKIAAKKKTAGVPKKKAVKAVKKTVKALVIEPPLAEITTHGEDLHIIPVKGETHPIGILEAHQVENRFQHREQVAFQAENQKVKQAMATRKGTKRIYRGQGR